MATAVGLPLGVAPGPVRAHHRRPAVRGATFLAFTDGLVERRGESIDDGLARLVGVATRPEPTLEALVSTVLAQLTEDGSEDDIAVLAFRWAEGDLKRRAAGSLASGPWLTRRPPPWSRSPSTRSSGPRPTPTWACWPPAPVWPPSATSASRPRWSARTWCA